MTGNVQYNLELRHERLW